MMNANKIASADMLDILFDGRNKDYGAYQLQRNYNKRLAIATGIVLFFCLVIIVTGILANAANKAAYDTTKIGPVILSQVDLTPKPEPLVIPHRPAAPVAQVQYTVPLIVPNTEIKDEMLPVGEIDDAIISTVTVAGEPEVGNAPPPEKIGTGLAVAPAQLQIKDDTIFRKVEIPAEFPGDWKRFLERNLIYPEQAIENHTEGVVKLQFIVDKSGDISEITALNDPGDGLAEEAIRIIRKCPKWHPAEQNGRKVNYMHIQTIIFRLQSV
jgi:protein TonB